MYVAIRPRSHSVCTHALHHPSNNNIDTVTRAVYKVLIPILKTGMSQTASDGDALRLEEGSTTTEDKKHVYDYIDVKI